ncbi:hypothetical protein BH20ACT14_BH20ACT14_11220 [soil metagenome]
MIEDDDQVGATDRRQPMRDDERRSAGEEVPKPSLDFPLGADVDRGGGLVEDENVRVGEERTREGDQLPLSQREPEAALAELRVVALR